MKTKTPHPDWISHIPPVLTALLALAMLVLTPIWAVDYYHQPFPGVLLEPNNIISKINGQAWPARQAGAAWPEQLVAVNAAPVKTTQEIAGILASNGNTPVRLEFLRQDGTQRSLTVTPIHMPAWDFISLFIIPYLAGLIFLVIGLWAYRLRGGLRASRALLVFAAAVSVVTTTFFDMNTSHHVVVLWAVSLSVAASACIHLALVFPKQMGIVDRRPATRYISWALCLVFALPAAWILFFPPSPLAYIATWQASYGYMAAAIALFLGVLIWRILYSDSPIIRQQSRVIIFGAALAFAPMMIFYLLPTALSSNPQVFRPAIYFPLLVLLPLSITYAILRYRLLDVDRFLANVLTYALTTGVALTVFYGLAAGISFIIQKTVRADNPLLIALYLLALVAGLSPLRGVVQRIIDRLFYRAPADYRRVLNTLSSKLVITPDLERTLQLLSEQLRQALAPESFIVYLYDDERGLYVPHSRDEREIPAMAADDPLVRAIRAVSTAVWFPPNKDLPPELQHSDTYHALGCCAFVPLNYEGSLVGFMALGLRRSGDPYTSDDLDFLGTVAGQSALALENARLFTNLRRTLDQTLEMKNLMDDIFASIATGVITTNVQRQITLFNQAAVNILGIPLQDVIGKPLLEALPALSPDFDMAASDALDRGAITLSREVLHQAPPRGDLYLRLSCAPLRDAHLGTKGATIVFEDLTERHKLETEQEHIRQTFGRVVAPRIRDRLLSDPSHLRLNGIRQQVTILFADLSGFTSFSERIKPEVLFKVLNDYLSLAAEAILAEEGTLDKFMGDAVMAMWNAPDPQPDHALRAVRAALAILAGAQEAHSRLKDPAHHLLFRIGVTCGDAMVGNVGTRDLFNYTAVGDTVNLAQRLEVTAKPGQVLIDQATHAVVADKVMALALEPVQVKGKAQPVAIFDLKGLK